MGKHFSLYGRLWINFLCMLAQGGMNICFARTDTFDPSLVVMIVFAILVQVSMGTIFSIVPYVDSANTGSVAGIVGAGGNVGAALLGLVFMYHDYDAMEYMAHFTLAVSFLTPLIVIKGYKGIVFGTDDHDETGHKHQHSPLMVPKILHSPHFVKFSRKAPR
jgi:NNP family nitrate/nitrite transporter-like MFS transporter